MNRLRASLRATVATFAGIARNPNLRRLEAGFAASVSADRAFTVALGVYAFQAGGAIAVGLVGLARMLPAAILSPLAAGLGERFERERILVAVSLISAIAVGGCGAAFYLDTANESAALPEILGLAIIHAIVATLVRPEVWSLLPSLATTPEELIGGNAASSTIGGLGTLIGPIGAGVVVAAVDPGAVFVLGAVAYVLAALCFGLIRVEGRLHLAIERTGGVLAAFRVLARDRQVLLVMALFAVQSVVTGAVGVMYVVIAFEVLKTGASWVGFLLGAFGAGTFIGGLASGALRGNRIVRSFAAGLVLRSLPFIGLALLPVPLNAIAMFTVVGIGNSVEDVGGFSLLQRLVSDEMIGRVLALLFGATMAGNAVGSIVAPALLLALGPQGTLLALGAFLPTIVLLSARGLRAIERSAVTPSRELELIDLVPMFRPLSVVAKECLAASLVPEHVAPGTTICAEGEPGNRFYLVASGRVRVLQGGVPVDGRGSHDYFGEIALLREMLRTATVVAEDEVDLLTLDRDRFIAAVTQHRASSRAADTVVADRLAS